MSSALPVLMVRLSPRPCLQVLAHFHCIPGKLDALGLRGIGDTFAAIGNVRQINTGLCMLGMLPSLVDFRNPAHVLDLAELRSAYPNETMPVAIGLRNSIAEALGSGAPVWESKKTSARKAATEMRAVAQHIFHAMNLKESDHE